MVGLINEYLVCIPILIGVYLIITGSTDYIFSRKLNPSDETIKKIKAKKKIKPVGAIV